MKISILIPGEEIEFVAMFRRKSLLFRFRRWISQQSKRKLGVDFGKLNLSGTWDVEIRFSLIYELVLLRSYVLDSVRRVLQQLYSAEQINHTNKPKLIPMHINQTVGHAQLAPVTA